MSGQIKVTIDKLGRVKTIDVNGVEGASCADLTAGIEQAVVSSSVTCDVSHKPEYYEQTDGTVVEQDQGW